ncbi:Cyclin [Seminavis robusta]|uniref:Cyclin n=1 Tax=Seminavis robusta TaxID=568900 RepID=A0A9N8F1X3_9STRA|nr:Cyclin [Seminavis robusta]|eukprot:Sro2691_g334780.1 Cyclin (388) ;mRNA; r:6145-7308
MADFSEASQLHDWMLASPAMLDKCRAKGNLLAREYLAKPKEQEEGSTSTTLPPVEKFACGYARAQKENPDNEDPASMGPQKDASNHEFLTTDEEEFMVTFYASKIPFLIGPTAQHAFLRRPHKFPATAAALFRRFYLSNSVMIHDPKAVMVAAAFLASKVEDGTARVRELEKGTELMQSPVTQAEILPAELFLLDGIRFQLMCFHSFKPVEALTEDLRTFLKSERGITLVQNKRIASEDLKPLFHSAWGLLDDVMVSDIPLLFTPGQVGLAAMIVANETVQAKQAQKPEEEEGLPPLDLLAYVKLRFSEEQGRQMEEKMKDLVPMIKGLKEGKHGCGNHTVDMAKLKAVHKKLKKCRLWGKKEKKSKKRSAEGGEESKKKKSKKNKD